MNGSQRIISIACTAKRTVQKDPKSMWMLPRVKRRDILVQLGHCKNVGAHIEMKMCFRHK